VLDFLDTWVAGGLGLGGLGLGVGLGLPQAPQSPCEFVSVGHVWTPISSSACSVCSFLFFFTSINIFCFQQVMSPQSPSPTYHHPNAALYTRAASSLSRFAQTRHAPPYDPKYCLLLTATYQSSCVSMPRRFTQAIPICELDRHSFGAARATKSLILPFPPSDEAFAHTAQLLYEKYPRAPPAAARTRPELLHPRKRP
jgi:hypothetical protein